MSDWFSTSTVCSLLSHIPEIVMNPSINSSSIAAQGTPARRPKTIVLQPQGQLNQANLTEFQQTLETALEQVTEAVIVDLLWVETIASPVIGVMAIGMQRAIASGKVLSFQSMNLQMRTALEAECDRLRELTAGPWHDSFEQELENFLDSWTQDKKSLPLGWCV
jgi:anti-anti-sigma regulatory factor